MNLEKTIASLKRNYFDVSVFSTKEEAADYLNARIDGKTVGIGGSMTIEAMGIYETLCEHNQVSWHAHTPEGMTADQVRQQAAVADIYLTSVNALSENGELVNIDGCGNRVASTLYGHEKVYFITGVNKIAPDLSQAIDRARNIASPLNAKRLNCATPCAVKGDKCYDCDSPDRICSAMVIHFKKMIGDCDMEVVLIEKELGF